jgi:hypothetical protein
VTQELRNALESERQAARISQRTYQGTLRLLEWRAKLGQALAHNLNKNVMKKP